MQTKTHSLARLTLARLALGVGLSLLVLACGDDNATSPQPPVENDPASSSSLVAVPSSSSVVGGLSSSATQPSPSSSSLALVEAVSSSSGTAESQFNPNVEYGELPDSRDGQTYRTVVIDTQTWMAENLNYDPGTGNSSCYDNVPANCETYGRLYDWSTAMGFAAECNSESCKDQIKTPHQGICPEGWHLPRNAEWSALIKAAGEIAVTTLKSATKWNGLDTYGFSALPGGYRHSEGTFHTIGTDGHWWSGSEHPSLLSYAYYRSLFSSGSGGHVDQDIKSNGFSVRCVKD
jgi:uncharacterized protein (TIGR02145 family)